VDLAFADAYAVGAGGQVALEDYARVLTGAEGAEALVAAEGAGRILGLHLCAPVAPLPPAVVQDIEAFAREMAERVGDGLGWA
jgi:hypothetical protein